MSRTTRNTYMTAWTKQRRDKYANDTEWYHRRHPLERDPMFNGRDNHRGEICGAGTNSPKGKDSWDEYWGYDKRGVKRATAKIIRRRGKDEIAKAVKEDQPKGPGLFY